MFFYTKELAHNTYESVQEKYLMEKCKILLDLLNKSELRDLIRDKRTFYQTFCSSVISKSDLHLILLKKYYLATDNDTLGYTKIDKFLRWGFFEEIEEEIDKNPELRVTLMKNYLKHMDYSNSSLATNKSYTHGYDNVNETIIAINNFYKKEKHSGIQKKKEFV